MNIDYIEDLINRENINLINTYLQDTKGAFINYGKIKAILYDNKKIENTKQRKEVFMEELSHYYTDSTYHFNSDTNFINKQEYRAKKYMYNALISYENLKSAILNRI